MVAYHDTNGTLHIENVNLTDIATQVGTPVYCYSAAGIRQQYQNLNASLKAEGLDVNICYAVKANSNQAIITVLANEGAGGDVVSGGELMRCLQAGISPQKIVFSSVGKQRWEIELALDKNIHQINVESETELDLIQSIAMEKGVVADVVLRVNPGVATDSVIAKTSTGERNNKFGIWWQYALDVVAPKIANMSHVHLVGLSVHIASGVLDANEFRMSFRRMAEVVKAMREKGFNMQRLDLGGGLGIAYKSTDYAIDFALFAKIMREEVGALGCELAIEPGKVLVGESGLLLTEVINVKQEPDRPTFVVVDAGMDDMPRVALYNAYHHIRPVKTVTDTTPYWDDVDVCGAVCETTDTFMQLKENEKGYHTRRFPQVQKGELVVIENAGAYCAAMAYQHYNTRPLVPEVLVDGDKFAVIRARTTIESIIEMDSVPAWLK